MSSVRDTLSRILLGVKTHGLSLEALFSRDIKPPPSASYLSGIPVPCAARQSQALCRQVLPSDHPCRFISRREPERFLLRSRLRPVETISAANLQSVALKADHDRIEGLFFDANHRLQDRLLHVDCSIPARQPVALLLFC